MNIKKSAVAVLLSAGVLALAGNDQAYKQRKAATLKQEKAAQGYSASV